jgi:recombination protein RecA
MNNNLKKLMKGIEKKHGKDTELDMKLGDREPVEVISTTGSYNLDYAFGCLGIPKGKIIQYYGRPSSGKSTLAMISAGCIQKSNPDKTVALLDYEKSFDPTFAQNLGMDVDNLLKIVPATLEDGFDMIQQMAESNTVSVCIIDSIADMTPRQMIGAEYDDNFMAIQAREFSKCFLKIRPVLNKSDMTLIMINQVTTKGIGTAFTYEASKASNKVNHELTLDVHVKKGKEVGKKNEVLGYETIFTVKKNKVGVPMKTAETTLWLGGEDGKTWGIDSDYELIDIGLKLGFITLSGAWYSYGDTQIGQGKVKGLNYLRENNLVDELKKKVMDELNRQKTEGV